MLDGEASKRTTPQPVLQRSAVSHAQEGGVWASPGSCRACEAKHVEWGCAQNKHILDHCSSRDGIAKLADADDDGKQDHNHVESHEHSNQHTQV